MASRQLKTRLLRSLGSWNSRFRASGQVSRQHEGQEERILVPSPFIVGEGRSGTTLLRLMLDAHPDLAIPPETRFITRVAKACKKGSDPRRTFVEFMTSHRKWGDFRIEDSLLEELQNLVTDDSRPDLQSLAT